MESDTPHPGACDSRAASLRQARQQIRARSRRTVPPMTGRAVSHPENPYFWISSAGDAARPDAGATEIVNIAPADAEVRYSPVAPTASATSEQRLSQHHCSDSPSTLLCRRDRSGRPQEPRGYQASLALENELGTHRTPDLSLTIDRPLPAAAVWPVDRGARRVISVERLVVLLTAWKQGRRVRWHPARNPPP